MEAAEKSYRPLSVVDRSVRSTRQERSSHPLNFAKDTIFYSGPRDVRETMVLDVALGGGRFYPIIWSRDHMSCFGEAMSEDGKVDRVWLHRKAKDTEGWRKQIEPDVPGELKA